MVEVVDSSNDGKGTTTTTTSPSSNNNNNNNNVLQWFTWCVGDRSSPSTTKEKKTKEIDAASSSGASSSSSTPLVLADAARHTTRSRYFDTKWRDLAFPPPGEGTDRFQWQADRSSGDKERVEFLSKVDVFIAANRSKRGETALLPFASLPHRLLNHLMVFTSEGWYLFGGRDAMNNEGEEEDKEPSGVRAMLIREPYRAVIKMSESDAMMHLLVRLPPKSGGSGGRDGDDGSTSLTIAFSNVAARRRAGETLREMRDGYVVVVVRSIR